MSKHKKRNLALDGIKGVGIIAIILYHYFRPIFPGGFMGVEIFFTLTGFLIASSILRDLTVRYSSDLNLDLGDSRKAEGGWKGVLFFYLKRLVRLWPAMLLMIPTVTIAAWFINKDALVGIGQRIAATLTFSYNYYEIFHGGSYFAQTVPQLLEPMWFVALSAQFYLVIPAYMALVFAWGKSLRPSPRLDDGGLEDREEVLAARSGRIDQTSQAGHPGRTSRKNRTNRIDKKNRKNKGNRQARQNRQNRQFRQSGERKASRVTQVSRTLEAYSAFAQQMKSAGAVGFGLSLLLSVAGAGFMALLYRGDPQEATRVYFGFLTHSFGLFLGVSFAFLLLWLRSRRMRAQAEQAFLESTRGNNETVVESLIKKIQIGRSSAGKIADSRVGRILLPLLSFLSLLVFVFLCFGVRRADVAFWGGLLLVSLLTILIIWGSMGDRSWMRALFSWAPLRYMGRYSFGLYLWHWPLYILARLALPGLRGRYDWVLAAIAFLLTVIMTFLSGRFVEDPVNDWVRSRLSGPEAKGSGRRLTALIAGLVVLALWTGAGLVLARAPQVTSIEAQLQAQAALLKESQNGVAGRPSGKKGADASSSSSSGTKQAGTGAKEAKPAQPKSTKQPKGAKPSKPSTPTDQPTPLPLPPSAMPSGGQITAIGDSVMLGSASSLQERFPGITIDAQVSRFLSQGIDIVARLRSQGLLRKYILIGLSTNGSGTMDQWNQLYAAAGPGHVFLVVNAHMDRSWTQASNQNVQNFVNQHAHDACLVDWNAAASAHPSWLASDGIHAAGKEGADLYAQTVYRSLNIWLGNQRQAGR